MFKTREGGGQRPFKQCLKKLHNWLVMASLNCLLCIHMDRNVTLELHDLKTEFYPSFPRQGGRSDSRNIFNKRQIQAVLCLIDI